MNNLPKVVAQQRRGWASNPRLLDRKSDALPLSHRACYCDNECQFFVDRIYNDVLSVLNNAAHIYVPQSHKNFYKFWWGEELKIAKAQSVESNNIWKAVGKPRQAPVFEKRNKYRLAYRQSIREEQKREKLS